MSGPVTSTRKFSDFGSNDALAKVLIERFPEQNWQLKPRSLGAKIGELDRGLVTWWSSRPEKTECLAKLLEVPLEDLAIHSNVGSNFFQFTEFPEFPPLDLRREELRQFAEEQLDKAQSDANEHKESLALWLDRRALRRGEPQDIDWLLVPDDSRRQLLIRQLSAAGLHEVVAVDTLIEIGERLTNAKPLVVCIAHDGGDEDLLALAHRPRNAGLLVIAPFMLPRRAETSSAEILGWEQRAIGGIEGKVFDLSGNGVRRWALPALSDWRARLLNRIGAHLDRSGVDTSFNAQAVDDWLHRFDPSAVWFRTTSDVMQLSRLAHLHSEKRLPDSCNSSAGKRLAELLFAREPSSCAFRIRQLADARWQCGGQPWDGGLPLDAWLAISTAAAASVSRSELDEIVFAKTMGEREKAADRVAVLLEAGSPEALLSSGLLHEIRRGYFDFRHRTFAGLLIRDRLMAQIATESPSAWAINCFDAGRRPLVDAALNAVSMEHLVNAANRLAAEPAESAQAIAASEALFVAIGKRIAQEEVIPPSLFFIVKQIVQRLDLSDDWSLAKPWSRPASSPDECLAWVCACWSWSLLPETKVEIEPCWLFPGWADALPEVPYWLTGLVPEDEALRVSPALRKFLRVLDLWAKELDEPIESAPAMLLLPFLNKAARGVLPAESSWWKTLIGKKWAESLLLESLDNAGEGAACRLWSSYLAAEQEVLSEAKTEDRYNFPHLNFCYSPIRFWLLQHLKPAEAVERLSDANRSYLSLRPESLPPAVRPLLLQSVLACPPVQLFSEALPFLERFGFHAASALEGYLGHPVLGNAAAQCLWRWNAERASSLLSRSGNVALEVRETLLWHCPDACFLLAVEVLATEPELFDTETRKLWIRKYLPSSGRGAVTALALLDSGQ